MAKIQKKIMSKTESYHIAKLYWCLYVVKKNYIYSPSLAKRIHDGSSGDITFSVVSSNFLAPVTIDLSTVHLDCMCDMKSTWQVATRDSQVKAIQTATIWLLSVQPWWYFTPMSCWLPNFQTLGSLLSLLPKSTTPDYVTTQIWQVYPKVNLNQFHSLHKIYLCPWSL